MAVPIYYIRISLPVSGGPRLAPAYGLIMFVLHRIPYCLPSALIDACWERRLNNITGYRRWMDTIKCTENKKNTAEQLPRLDVSISEEAKSNTYSHGHTCCIAIWDNRSTSQYIVSGKSFWVWEVLMASRGRLHWLQKVKSLYWLKWKNYPTSRLTFWFLSACS